MSHHSEIYPWTHSLPQENDWTDIKANQIKDTCNSFCLNNGLQENLVIKWCCQQLLIQCHYTTIHFDHLATLRSQNIVFLTSHFYGGLDCFPPPWIENLFNFVQLLYCSLQHNGKSVCCTYRLCILMSILAVPEQRLA